MTVTGISVERAQHIRMNELRHEAFVAAQIQQAPHRPYARLAAGLRALAARLERSGSAPAGPWHEDFIPMGPSHA